MRQPKKKAGKGKKRRREEDEDAEDGAEALQLDGSDDEDEGEADEGEEEDETKAEGIFYADDEEDGVEADELRNFLWGKIKEKFEEDNGRSPTQAEEAALKKRLAEKLGACEWLQTTESCPLMRHLLV